MLPPTSCNDGEVGKLQPGGGLAGGWIIKFPNGETLYHAGDTNVFGDMALYSDLYQPQIAILPIGGHYCMVRI